MPGTRTPAERLEEAERLFSEGLACLAEGELGKVRAAFEQLLDLVGEHDSRPHLLSGELAWDRDGPQAALPHLLRAVELDRDDADSRYRLALAYEELGDHQRMRRELMQVRALDAEADRRAGVGTEEELTFIAEVAADAIAALPDELAARLAHVPVVLEPRPSLHLVSEGFDPRALGLFEGPGQLDGHDAIEAPTRIVLYTANLLAEPGDDDELAEQIEITVLHEIGHYFGFEEEDMQRLGLE